MELDLNPAGEGDLDENALAKLDIVIGCFHSALRRKEDQTSRYLAAIRHPSIEILGHPRGRIYNYRIGLTADWARVFAEAAERDKAVEIDAYPDRQDLSPDLLVLAKRPDAGFPSEPIRTGLPSSGSCNSRLHRPCGPAYRANAS